MTWPVIWASVSGIAFAVTMLVMAVRFPRPTPFQTFVFRSVLALSAGSMAAAIPGFLEVEANLTGFGVRAGGALAVFVLVYKLNSANLQTASDTSLSALSDSIEESIKATSALTAKLNNSSELKGNPAAFLRDPDEVKELRRIIRQIIHLQRAQMSFPNMLRNYSTTKRPEAWRAIAEDADDLSQLVASLSDSLSRFDSDFVVHRIEDYRRLIATVAGRGEALRELGTMPPPRSGRTVRRLLGIADNYELLIAQLKQAEDALAAYARQRLAPPSADPSARS